MKPPPEFKKRKVDGAGVPSRRTSSAAEDDTDICDKSIGGDHIKVHAARTSNINIKIQQAKNFAVSQAQQDCCTGNFRIFDSPFGNFLVPVIPTREDLSR